MKIVHLVWEDAGDLEQGPWTYRDEAKPSAPFIFHQVGYLYELTPDAVVLTPCVGDVQMAPRTRIPRGMVRSLTELKPGKPVAIPKRRKARKA
jgi:hypothetical protein